MSPGILLTTYCVVIVAASLAGGWLPSRFRLTHTRLQILMSFLGGLMMGVAVLHLLPHAVVKSGSLDTATVAVLIGLLAMLLLVRCFHFHQHDLPGEPDPEHSHDAEGHCHSDKQSDDRGHAAHAHCDHGDVHSHADLTAGNPYGWVGLFFGLAIHTLLDGIALGASVSAESHGQTASLVGLGTFLAVALHKPLDSLSLTSLMAVSGWKGQTPAVVNVVYSLICPAGALLFYYGIGHVAHGQSAALGWTLGLAAGIFLCIALVDVVPEIQFHSHDRLKLSTALLCGVIVAWGIGVLEPDHAHKMSPRNQGSPAAIESPL